ncbi:uncharacterized protein LOC117643699 [Thrips palmi]|uniref:Uncharacterized protein LOC117643699 n=1 Tax=Thrips palmi TaxID=161013 RepID=A0A6P8YP40_THRPL|nr:uncharacterized protein LOC117643699 [Thrips palmi]
MKLFGILFSAPQIFYLFLLLYIAGIELNPGPFPCKSCAAVPETISCNIRHQHLHSVSRNFLYHCPAPSCIFSTKSFNFMNKHVSMFHSETSHIDPEATNTIGCVCESGGIPCAYSTTSFWELVQHLCTHLDSDVEVGCPILGCEYPNSFRKKSTFRVHLSQYHPNWRDEGCPKQHLRRNQENLNGGYLGPNCDEAMDTEDGGANISPDSNQNMFDDAAVIDCIAKFYLQLYGLHTLPFETIQDICNGIICMTEVIHAKMNQVLTEELEKLNIPQDQINLIRYKVMQADLLYASHHKDNSPGPYLSSDYYRREYFMKYFGFCSPKEMHLDEDDHDNHLRQEIIPITPTLLRLFQDPVICKDIDDSFLKQADPSNDIVSDYTEGLQFISENHPSKEIHIFVYQDTVNAVMNALGSAKNKHKLLTMYFTVGNLKSHRRAKVESKHLMMIMRESVFKEVKAPKSLEEVMKELKSLETEGILYKGENVSVAVVFIQGDNLGQHLIGGFIESFSTKFFCRFCEILRAHFKANPTSTSRLRTKADYTRCALRAMVMEKPIKGIKAGCEFNDLKYFHATTHLAPCLAHDLFEGVVSWDLAGIISNLIRDKWFSRKWLNKKIKAFKCVGADSPNKPAFVEKKGLKLGGHAVQNWTLLRLLPFILGDKIADVEHSSWKLYLQLKEITESFTPPSFYKSDMPYAQDVLLPAYFERRAEVLDIEKYPLNPKHHFLYAHYAFLMCLLGPLIHLWTLPYEQRHKFFKHLLRLSQNFINPEHSCAYRYLLHVTYMSSDGPTFQEECVEVSSKQMTPDLYSAKLANIVSSSFQEPGWRDCTSVCFDGLQYKKEDVLLLSENQGNILTGTVKVIAVKDNVLSFICELNEATFDSSLGIHTMPEPSGNLKCISFNELRYPVPHPIYFFRGRLSFSLKHKLLRSN